MMVCGDGYILDVLGPYSARLSDAQIMLKLILNNGNPIEDGIFHYYFEEGDIFILDKGFRDSIPLLEQYGYKAYMPITALPGETQLTTEDANKSRLVTMVRWVVETINGRFKRDFKLFRNRIFNKNVPFICEDFKIAAALINFFQEPYADSLYLLDFIDSINRNMGRPNLLAEYVLQNNLNMQRVPFHLMAADDPAVNDFPQLSMDDIIKFSIGTYHVKIARSYCSEHIKATGVFFIQLYRHPVALPLQDDQNNILIRCKIQSRHIGQKIYYSYVMYNNVIKETYCSCYHGKRTLGSYAHVISIIYYLGWARYNGFDHPALEKDYVFIDIEND